VEKGKIKQLFCGEEENRGRKGKVREHLRRIHKKQEEKIEQ
jgi:hypothetical protein